MGRCQLMSMNSECKMQKSMKYCKRLPDVIIIGVKKCGTITLGNCWLPFALNMISL